MEDEKRTKGLARLREPFLPEQISKLPKPTCPMEEWKKLPKSICRECGAYHATTKTTHIDYVGHAALTARLLEADPDWNWEPIAFGTDGYPAIDKDGGMWIRLTVCGVTRLGYGDAQGKTGGNATKERIGDALRNAAMRFGAALDLWHKGESPLFGEENNVEKPQETITEAQENELHALITDNELDADGKYLPRLLKYLKVDALADLPANSFDKAKDAINQAIAKRAAK